MASAGKALKRNVPCFSTVDAVATLRPLLSRRGRSIDQSEAHEMSTPLDDDTSLAAPVRQERVVAIRERLEVGIIVGAEFAPRSSGRSDSHRSDSHLQRSQ